MNRTRLAGLTALLVLACGSPEAVDSGAPEAERDWVSFTRALASDAYGGSIRLIFPTV